MSSQIQPYHIPVLLNQVLRFLEPLPGKIFIDATLGLGGHTKELISRMNDQGAVYGIETDERNLISAKKNLAGFKNIHFIHDNFENLEEIGTRVLKQEGRIDGIFFDLGLSSPHIEEGQRGFSFQREGPLDMRFNQTQGILAADIVNTYSLEQLTQIFQTYGEEKFSYRIAKHIIQLRRRNKFKTTTQLKTAVEECIPHRYSSAHYSKIHPATRIFQALRIAANREIEVLGSGLNGALNVISKHGRIVVISYHSLEDRVVKNFFRDNKKNGLVKILTKKPIRPDREEMMQNRRSRSAKLRAAENN
ncbi:16S rRNA (cytosine(1402)-N(4))-methyltransferase RsmH [Candidatus Peregrinibacteria bacterium]|nr:16S rRNA (cytosine(1402)-N(4))-methyltransferase RsmH [Candidatus Peregrinibacteria bacterium]